MIWGEQKRFLLLSLLALALLLLLSPPCYSVDITEDELIQLETIFETLKTQNEDLLNSLESASSALEISRMEVGELRNQSNQLRRGLTEAERLQNQVQKQLTEVRISFDRYVRETRAKNMIAVIGTAVVSGLAGFFIGGAF